LIGIKKLSFLIIWLLKIYKINEKKFGNTLPLDLHLKNKAATFALPNGNNGSENDRGHEF
jgi:hypothetical protein